MHPEGPPSPRRRGSYNRGAPYCLGAIDVNPKESSDMPIPLAQAGLAAVLSAAAPTGSNPLLAPWTGPYGGIPPFDQVKVEQFEPAWVRDCLAKP